LRPCAIGREAIPLTALSVVSEEVWTVPDENAAPLLVAADAVWDDEKNAMEIISIGTIARRANSRHEFRSGFNIFRNRFLCVF
jgi:hypothetical protein